MDNCEKFHCLKAQWDGACAQGKPASYLPGSFSLYCALWQRATHTLRVWQVMWNTYRELMACLYLRIFTYIRPQFVDFSAGALPAHNSGGWGVSFMLFGGTCMCVIWHAEQSNIELISITVVNMHVNLQFMVIFCWSSGEFPISSWCIRMFRLL